VRVCTWNVNSIRRRAEIVLAWAEANHIDVLLLQETKVEDESFPREPFEKAGYHLALFGQKGGRNGVAIASKAAIEDVARGLDGEPEDEQARYIEADIDGLRVASVYVPNGTSLTSDNYPYKRRFLERLQTRALNFLEAERPAVLGGDWNVAPDPFDVYDAEALSEDVCYHADVRRRYRALLHTGLYDAFRAVHPTRRQFSWWDLRGGAWDRDEGMRIDHLLCTPQSLDRLATADIDPTPRTGKGVSDHVPVWCAIDG